MTKVERAERLQDQIDTGWHYAIHSIMERAAEPLSYREAKSIAEKQVQRLLDMRAASKVEESRAAHG